MNKLVTVTNKEILSKLKKEDVTKVYPLRFFSVGYNEYFDISEIDDFCLINRILTDDDLDKLDNILKNSNIKGILFDDLGVLDIIKNLNITKIFIGDHINNNASSINYYLDYVDSIVVSSDITYDEIKYITEHVKKDVVIYTFGLKALMYSRRNLLDNYEEYYNLEKDNEINTSINDKHFKVIESNFGTRIYAYPFYYDERLKDLDHVLYNWYDVNTLDNDKIISVINDDLSNVPVSNIFLNKKTVFKVGDLDA